VAAIQCIEDCPPLPVVEGVEIRHVPEFLGYAAGDDGSVWCCWPLFGHKCLIKWKRASTPPNKIHGYRELQVTSRVFENQRRKQRTVIAAVLVCTAFHGPRPIGMQVCHGDGVRTNDSAINLRWGTPSENVRDAFRHGTAYIPGGAKGEENPTSKLTVQQVLEIRASNMSQRSLARHYGVSRGAIQWILTRRSWKHI
jgi:hypothetical protein